MRRLLVIALLTASCSSAVSAADPPADATGITNAAVEPEFEPIALSLSLYVVSEVETEDSPAQPSKRTEDEVAEIAEKIQQIWSEAGIIFEPVNIRTIEVSPDLLAALGSGDSRPFLTSAGDSFEVPDPGMINGFYIASAGGANGFTPIGSRVLFVIDDPSVHDERVSSHEIGHILGLHHELNDADRLMFSGTNGMTLTGTEIAVARYNATGILNGTR